MINKYQIFGKDRYIVATIFLGFAVVFWGLAGYAFAKPQSEFDLSRYKSQEMNKCMTFAKDNGYQAKKLSGDRLQISSEVVQSPTLTFISVREVALACNNMSPISLCLGDRSTCKMPEGNTVGLNMVFRFAV